MTDDPLLTHLTQCNYTALEDDPRALVRVWHLPSRKRGLFGASPMHSVALLELLGDGPSRLLELVLEAGQAVDHIVTGGSASDVTNHPILNNLAGMIAPGRTHNRQWRHPPHRIAIILDTEEIPEWAQSVVNGTLSHYPRRTVACAIRNTRTGQLCLPATDDPKPQPTITWLHDLFAASDK